MWSIRSLMMVLFVHILNAGTPNIRSSYEIVSDASFDHGTYEYQIEDKYYIAIEYRCIKFQINKEVIKYKPFHIFIQTTLNENFGVTNFLFQKDKEEAARNLFRSNIQPSSRWQNELLPFFRHEVFQNILNINDKQFHMMFPKIKKHLQKYEDTSYQSLIDPLLLDTYTTMLLTNPSESLTGIFERLTTPNAEHIVILVFENLQKIHDDQLKEGENTESFAVKKKTYMKNQNIEVNFHVGFPYVLWPTKKITINHISIPIMVGMTESFGVPLYRSRKSENSTAKLISSKMDLDPKYNETLKSVYTDDIESGLAQSVQIAICNRLTSMRYRGVNDMLSLSIPIKIADSKRFTFELVSATATGIHEYQLKGITYYAIVYSNAVFSMTKQGYIVEINPFHVFVQTVETVNTEGEKKPYLQIVTSKAEQNIDLTHQEKWSEEEDEPMLDEYQREGMLILFRREVYTTFLQNRDFNYDEVLNVIRKKLQDSQNKPEKSTVLNESLGLKIVNAAKSLIGVRTLRDSYVPLTYIIEFHNLQVTISLNTRHTNMEFPKIVCAFSIAVDGSPIAYDFDNASQYMQDIGKTDNSIMYVPSEIFEQLKLVYHTDTDIPDKLKKSVRVAIMDMLRNSVWTEQGSFIKEGLLRFETYLVDDPKSLATDVLYEFKTGNHWYYVIRYRKAIFWINDQENRYYKVVLTPFYICVQVEFDGFAVGNAGYTLVETNLSEADILLTKENWKTRNDCNAKQTVTEITQNIKSICRAALPVILNIHMVISRNRIELFKKYLEFTLENVQINKWLLSLDHAYKSLHSIFTSSPKETEHGNLRYRIIEFQNLEFTVANMKAWDKLHNITIDRIAVLFYIQQGIGKLSHNAFDSLNAYTAALEESTTNDTKSPTEPQFLYYIRNKTTDGTFIEYALSAITHIINKLQLNSSTYDKSERVIIKRNTDNSISNSIPENKFSINHAVWIK